MTTYSKLSIFLHWLMALIIIGVAGLGLFLDDLRGPAKIYWVNLHGVFGVSIVLLLGLRLVWRRFVGVPAPAASLTRAERIASIATHHSLYLLMFIIPLFGLVSLMAKGRGLDFMVMNMPPLIGKDRSLSEWTEDVHSVLAFTLMGLVSVHILGALWHRFVKKDDVVNRMLPAIMRR